MKSQDSISYYQHHAHRLSEEAGRQKTPADVLPFLESLSPKSRVLDLGCGSGIDLTYMNKAGHTGIGMEAAPKLVEIARLQNPGIEILHKNFLFLNLKEAEWDGIWANSSLHHHGAELVQRVIAGCFRGLKPRGVLGLILYEGEESFEDREGDLSGPPRYIHPLTEKAICSMLEQTGFKITRVGRKKATGSDMLPKLLVLAQKI